MKKNSSGSSEEDKERQAPMTQGVRLGLGVGVVGAVGAIGAQMVPVVPVTTMPLHLVPALIERQAYEAIYKGFTQSLSLSAIVNKTPLLVRITIGAGIVAGGLGLYYCTKRPRAEQNFFPLNVPGAATQILAHYSIEDFEKIKIDEKDILGEGNFGKVYKGRYQGKSVAIKKIEIGSDKNIPKKIHEAKIMVSLPSMHLITLYGYCVTSGYLHLVMELMEPGSLEKWLANEERKPPLSLNLMYKIALEIAYGLETLHQANITHRDLKTANILLQSDDSPVGLRAKITDFGISRILNPHKKSEPTEPLGTPGWAAPEAFIGSKEPTVDIYPFGLVLWWMACKMYHQPIKWPCEEKQIPKQCPLEFGILIKKCLEEKPAARPKAKDLAADLQKLFDTAENKNKDKSSMEPKAVSVMAPLY